ncbi:exopolysaccharide biosynthesis protein EpsF [Sphingomonas sp. MAH-20]|uniref:Exopolysaccharide biosynthesis protein EpsF n=1 Tax=Sphingomonas horti TaxID=2682842 RepID=A0A6I4IZI2_9SPHN|nr:MULTISPECIES: GNVR domain-containing protein [Sphingomonas]MBA2920733.1 exopolysaccharide biosynthesis protein EpsF [Sphingomonas sp. CGMCC 1.13658]MVO77669.1 exopolysaccharide biosynthesis protein EpsF [Sphingomonas horti]
MSLVQFLRILAARKAIILVTLLACFFAATVTVFLLPPRYEAHNRVRVDITKPDPLTGQMSQQMMNAYLGTQMNLITDVQTAGLVVDDLGWAVDPANQAAFEAAGRPGGDIRDWLAQRIVDNTKARFADSPNIMEISYRGTDPAQAQGLAQAIREAFLKLNREQRITTAQRSFAMFQEQAQRAQATLSTAEEQRTQFAKENGIVYQPGAVDLESAKLSALSSASTVPTPGQVVGAQGNSPVAMLKQQIAQAQETLGPNHPTMQALKRQLAAMEAQGGSRGSTVIGGTSRAEIESAYQAQKARVMAQADKMDRLNQMEADIAVKRDQYQKLAAKAAEMKSIAQASDTNMEPLGNTNLPDEPVWPNKPMIIAASIALGLVLGVLLALLVELFARRVRSEDDLEFATGAPVLAVVGQPRPETGLTSRILRLIDRRGARPDGSLAEA